MSQYRHILVVVDPAMKHGTAFTRGVELAKKSGARLTLLLATYNAALGRARFLDPELMKKAKAGYLSARRRWLEIETAKLVEQGIDASGIVEWHKPAYEEIARQAMALNPDLVVKDMERTSALSRAVFTPADWHLLRLCPAPLLLVNEQSSACPQRILAAVDPFDSNAKPHDLNDNVVNAALTMAYQCDSVVHVVHAYQYVPSAMPMGAETVFADATLFDEIRVEHRGEFLEFGQRLGIPEERMHLVEGDPADAIAALARDTDADLVVLGAVQRTGLRRILIGSTAEDILGSVTCDVLVLKPRDFTTALAQELGDLRAEREKRAQ